mgnify:FL=1
MKNFSSWLLVMFMGMFWAFRIIVAFKAQYQEDFGGFIAFNLTIEIILLFVAILCMILVLRRNIFGGILYLASYGFYFGGYIITNMLPSIMSGEAMNVSIMQNAFVSAVGLIIAFCVFFDLLVNSIRKRDPKDKKTDWFFNNEQYDRKYDERADKNEYRNY